MLSLSIIRSDLKEIRYYYSRKEMFDEAFKCMGQSDIVEKAEKYNNAVKSAPAKLYDLYFSLYIKNNTQESLSNELCYTPEYIQMLNKQLLKFLQTKLKEEEEVKWILLKKQSMYIAQINILLCRKSA